MKVYGTKTRYILSKGCTLSGLFHQPLTQDVNWGKPYNPLGPEIRDYDYQQYLTHPDDWVIFSVERDMRQIVMPTAGLRISAYNLEGKKVSDGRPATELELPHGKVIDLKSFNATVGQFYLLHIQREDLSSKKAIAYQLQAR